MAEAAFTLTEAQQAGIERTDLSLALTAGAGCGKTFVLARRYVKLLADDGRPDAPSRIVAVTFTEKAAIEMRQRVAALLTERVESAADPSAQAMFAEWLSRIPDSRISTIHGFCASILRSYAIEAGLDPAFGVLGDEYLKRRMLRDAVGRVARDAFDAPDEGLRLLLDSFSYEQILEQLTAAVDERWRWEAEAYADSEAVWARWVERRDEVERRTWEAFDGEEAAERMETLAGAPCEDPDDKLARHIAEQIRLMREILTDPDARTPGSFAALKSAGGKGKAAVWGGKEVVKARRAELKELIETFKNVAWAFEPLGEADRRAVECLAALTALAERVIDRYARDKREAGMLDFVDLLVMTRDLLVAAPGVRRRVAADIRQLLIDEFQDTDALQRELLYLAVDCEGAAPPPGRIFFVGDAKQSIYRFRGAEVEVFDEAREAMGPKGRYSLDLNFRTHAGGVMLVNRIFGPLMGAGYEPLEARRRETPAVPAAEFVFVDCPTKAKTPDRVRATARAIAGRIAEMIRAGERRVWDEAEKTWRPVRAGDIAILLRRLQNTTPYEEALHDAGVDHYVVAGAGLFRQQEVFDLLTALRAIDNPLDDIALMGFLRGGMVGLDDNTLTHIAEATARPYRRRLRDAGLAERLAPAVRAALAAAADVLDELSAIKDACALDELIERLLAATGFEAVLMAQHNGQRRCGNIHRILERARAAQADGASLCEFIAYLSELTVEEIRAEQAATEAEGGDVVRIMTIHRAKGLEFPVVVLADLNYSPADRSEALSLRSEWGLTLRANDAEEPGDPVSWAMARRADHDKDLAEDCRALYVAVTRHRDAVLFAADWELCTGGLGRPNSALRMLDDALDLVSARTAGEAAVGGGLVAPVRVWTEPVKRARVRPSWLDEAFTACDSPQALAAILDKPAADKDKDEEKALAAAPLLGPVGVTSRRRIAVTALAEFEACPACFRWRYELRVPTGAIPGAAPGEGSSSKPAGSSGGLDAATAGTVFHRCMELLDFEAPQPAAALMERALADLEVDADGAAMTVELERMLGIFRDRPLWAMLAGADKRFTELSFVTRFGALEVEGVIDLLCRDADGAWRIVDYKSDRVTADAVADHGRRYELQMLIYAAAAGRFLADQGAGGTIDATLYFLRPGLTHVFTAAELDASRAEERLATVAERLAACRESGRWPRRDDDGCRWCRYRPLCENSQRRV